MKLPETFKDKKEFEKHIRKYAKELNKILNFTPGMKNNKEYDINVAPACGDGIILLWKPNTNMGIYINFSIIQHNNIYKIHTIMYRLTTKQNPWIGLNNNFTKNIPVNEMAKKINNLFKEYELTNSRTLS